MQRRLRITSNVRNDTLEYLRLVRCGSQVRIPVLELELFAAKVVPKAIELAALVFFTLLIFKGVILNAFPHAARIFIQHAPHGVVRDGASFHCGADPESREELKRWQCRMRLESWYCRRIYTAINDTIDPNPKSEKQST